MKALAKEILKPCRAVSGVGADAGEYPPTSETAETARGVKPCRHTGAVTQNSNPIEPPAGMRHFLIHPRQRWPKEVGDFTPWLAANIGLLAACIGEPLTLAGREVPIGEERVRADLVAYDAAGGLVVVEAQM